MAEFDHKDVCCHTGQNIIHNQIKNHCSLIGRCFTCEVEAQLLILFIRTVELQ